MAFGFKNRDKQPYRALTEDDIRNRLYGSAVGITVDAVDAPPPKKGRGAQTKTKAQSQKRESSDEKAKIRDELQLLRKELEQTKRKLYRMRGLKAKKIRLLVISSVIFFILAVLVIVALQRIFHSSEPAPKPSAARQATRYSIQVAVSDNIAAAKKFSEDLESKGYKTFIHKSQFKSGKDKFTIYTGAFADKGSALKLLNKLKTKEGIRDSYITNMPK